MIDFEDIYSELEKDLVNNQKKLKVDSALNIYYGVNTDGNFRLSFLSSVIPPEIESTKLLRVSQGKESESVFWTCFDLLQSTAKHVFYTFCGDIVSSVENISDEKDALLILKNRFHTWKNLFKNETSTVSEELIRGLFGELFFIKNFMIDNYGVDNSIDAWSGPDCASKDFSIGVDWYEVKTVTASALSVKISSVTQLSSMVPGYLIIIRLETMSPKFDDGQSSISDLFKAILQTIVSEETKDKFFSKILSYDINISDESCCSKYKVLSCNHYKVDSKFPRLQDTDIKFQEICRVNYELIINTLEKFKEI